RLSVAGGQATGAAVGAVAAEPKSATSRKVPPGCSCGMHRLSRLSRLLPPGATAAWVTNASQRPLGSGTLVVNLEDGAPVPAAGPAATPSSATPVRRPRPKYLALPGEKLVMGLEHVAGRRAAFLVEGPFDLLAAIGWNLPAFAICGTHFPAERLPALA